MPRPLFVLTLSLFIVFAGSGPLRAQDTAAAHKALLQKDELVLKDHVLTMDEVTRYTLVDKEVEKAEADDPQLKDSLDKDDGGDGQRTLDQMAAQLGSSPKVVGILAGHGFTPRQYAVVTMTLVQASLASYALQSGVKPGDPALANVNPANLRFVQEHKAELEALGRK